MAATTCMTLWTTVSPVIWLSIFILLPFLFNFLNLRRYGEVEYWLTVIKVFTLVGIIFLGILLPMGASTSTQLLGTDAQFSPVKCGSITMGQCVSPPGFACILLTRKTDITDWREGSPFQNVDPDIAGRLTGLWECCCLAVFSYTGCETLWISASETERPRKSILKMARRLSFRITLYYVCAVFVLGLNVSADDPILGQFRDQKLGSYQGSFVLMVQRAGIPGLPHFITAVVILAALSVSNANLYLGVACFIDSLTDRVDAFMHWRVSAKLRSASPERIAMVSQSGAWYCRHCQERWHTSRFA